MNEQIQNVLNDVSSQLTELESVTNNDFGGFDLTTAEGRVIRLASDDGVIALYEFTGARTMILMSSTKFTAVSSALIAMNLRAHMLVSAQEVL